jgi:hypothetical protein
MTRPTLAVPARRWLAAGLLVLIPLVALAGPGAHGPNGEHLDAPAAVGGSARSASPRIEAHSELFELVGTLAGGELSLLIDRYATNEPLLNAQVEVESGGLKAKAKFHADLGNYAIDDAALLKKLAAPGEHPLVITVLAGQDSDLLDGVLRVSAPVDDDARHDPSWRTLALGATGALAIALVLGGLVWRRRATRLSHPSKGGLA